MIDVCYIKVPLKNDLNHIGISSRILTENIIRNKNLNVEFTKANLFTSTYQFNDNHIKKLNKFASIIDINIFVFDFMPSNTYKQIITNIKSEYVLITAYQLMEIISIKHLLDDNRKVILGGTVAILYEPSFIKKFLIKLGTKNIHNLIIVNGYVDLTTDLYSIIKKWEDVKILKNDFRTVWDCTNDYLQELRKLKNKNNKYDFVSFSLKMKCFWKKCKFCAYKELPECDFTDNTNRIIDSIDKTMKKYNCQTLRFMDSYFEFNDYSINILDKLKRTYNIGAVFLGVLSLLNPENIIISNRYLKHYWISIESFSDYSLSSINKGYKAKHIDKIIDNLIKYVSKDSYINFNMIMDLPVESIEDTKKNYEKAISIKEKLHKYKFKNVKYTFQPLSLNVNSTINKGITLKDNSNPSGHQRILQELKNCLLFKKYNSEILNEIIIPYNRGIPSDMDIISEKTFKYLNDWN